MATSTEGFRPLDFTPRPAEEIVRRAEAFFRSQADRRTVRHIGNRPVPRAAIEAIVGTAVTAPSGANKQPWTFCIVSDPAVKKRIRQAAEAEEYENYHGRMPEDWLDDLAPLGTDFEKLFLTEAPYLIVVFKQVHGLDGTGNKIKHYYVNESVGIACGLLIAAIHAAGLVTVTHTPSPMNFLGEVLGRPANERAFLLLPVGYPEAGAEVPVIERKGFGDVVKWYESTNRERSDAK